jgi:hypothetical protein
MLAKRRLETEGVIASSSEGKTEVEKEEEYTATFLARLNSFFQL